MFEYMIIYPGTLHEATEASNASMSLVEVVEIETR